MNERDLKARFRKPRQRTVEALRKDMRAGRIRMRFANRCLMCSSRIDSSNQSAIEWLCLACA